MSDNPKEARRLFAEGVPYPQIANRLGAPINDVYGWIRQRPDGSLIDPLELEGGHAEDEEGEKRMHKLLGGL